MIWIWILFTVLTDLFRDHEMGGWGKAGWVILLIILPYVGTLIYLIARGHGMRDRTIKAQAEAQQHFAEYVRQTAGGSGGAEELTKLSALHDQGKLSDAEFEAAKKKLLA